VPVKYEFGKGINEICIIDSNWKTKHLRTLKQYYKKAKYFDEVFDLIEKCYRNNILNLSIFNVGIIWSILDYLKIKVNTTFSSDYNIIEKSTGRLIKLVESLKGTKYLSGFGGNNYQETDSFKNYNIDLIYSEFSHPTYAQLWGGDFIKNLSIIDILFNCGTDEVRRMLGIEASNGISATY